MLLKADNWVSLKTLKITFVALFLVSSVLKGEEINQVHLGPYTAGSFIGCLYAVLSRCQAQSFKVTSETEIELVSLLSSFLSSNLSQLKLGHWHPNYTPGCRK